MPEETYVRGLCPICGLPRESLRYEITGYKGRNLYAVYTCHSCDIETEYHAQLSLGGDYITDKKVTDHRAK